MNPQLFILRQRQTVDVWRPTNAKFAGTDTWAPVYPSSATYTAVTVGIGAMSVEDQLSFFGNVGLGRYHLMAAISSDIRLFDVLRWQGKDYDVRSVTPSDAALGPVMPQWMSGVIQERKTG